MSHHSTQQQRIEALRDLLGAANVLIDQQSLTHFGTDWTRYYTPAPLAIVFPTCIADVQALVIYAAEHSLALVPSGGRTGLSAGAVATDGEVVVCLDKLNTIDAFNPVDGTLRCGAGVTTGEIQSFAEREGLYYPVDFASSGSSQIGGNVATNAGGIKVVRYGMTREWIAGLKVVTGTGELLDLNRGLVKNNAGYDLRHLVIGSEGTLGIVVEVTVRLLNPPAPHSVMLMACPSMPAIIEVLKAARSTLTLNAFEFFSDKALDKVCEATGWQRPVQVESPFYALLEFEQSDADAAQNLYAAVASQHWASDAVISQSIGQAQQLWAFRERISEIISHWVPYKSDISSVISKLPDMLAAIDEIVGRAYPEFEIVWFGHIGDGNVHLNVLKPEALDIQTFSERCGEVNTWVSEVVREYGGSVSAEHGIGLLKKSVLPYSVSPAELAIMRGIKASFDPHGIMNPGKIFD